MLHIAPEPAFRTRFSKIPNLDYLSGDLDSPWAMRKLNLTDLDLPDDTFDVILCSHVLEHVPDDRQAMAELLRVMKPGGWGILQVPILRETTYEDHTLQTPEERLQAFGQIDHVRIYGLDYRDRLEGAGFIVSIDNFADAITAAQRTSLGLPETEDIYLCRKSHVSGT